MKTKQELLDDMNEELWNLDRKKIKRFRKKRVDGQGRLMFDSTGTYIPKEQRTPNQEYITYQQLQGRKKNMRSEIKRHSDIEITKKKNHRNELRGMNQEISEEIEYGER